MTRKTTTAPAPDAAPNAAPASTPAPAPLPEPQTGGSYIRHPDGRLELVEGSSTEPPETRDKRKTGHPAAHAPEPDAAPQADAIAGAADTPIKE